MYIGVIVLYASGFRATNVSFSYTRTNNIPIITGDRGAPMIGTLMNKRFILQENPFESI